jgi:hypothetical protein
MGLRPRQRVIGYLPAAVRIVEHVARAINPRHPRNRHYEIPVSAEFKTQRRSTTIEVLRNSESWGCASHL